MTPVSEAALVVQMSNALQLLSDVDVASAFHRVWAYAGMQPSPPSADICFLDSLAVTADRLWRKHIRTRHVMTKRRIASEKAKRA